MGQASLLHILLFKMSKWKQKTLAAFGFKKKMMCKGKVINVDIANEVDLKDHFKSKCLYEGVHMTFLPYIFSVQVKSRVIGEQWVTSSE